jgi:hypothetical protein
MISKLQPLISKLPNFKFQVDDVKVTTFDIMIMIKVAKTSFDHTIKVLRYQSLISKFASSILGDQSEFRA